MIEDNVDKTGAVTFLDILGWKGIWQRDGEALSKLKNLVKSANSYLQTLRGQKNLVKFDPDHVTITSISDTIIILMHGNPKETIQVHGEIASYIIAYGLGIGLSLRGATAYGRYSYDEMKTIVGPAVDEAASWHELTNWIGVNLTPSAFFNFLYADDVWVKYPNIPFKSKSYNTGNSLALNWHSKYLELNYEYSNFLKFIQNQESLTPDISKYYENTYNFYVAQMHENCLLMQNTEKHSMCLSPTPLRIQTEDGTDNQPTQHNSWWIREVSEIEGLKIENISTGLSPSIPWEVIESYENHKLTLKRKKIFVGPHKLTI